MDSSVAALLMQQQGFDCIGVTMKLYDGYDTDAVQGKTCCSLNDVQDARSVAFSIGMPFYVFNFTQDFHTQVIDRFIASYEKGLTPNPCIDCNRYIKFDRLIQRALQMGFDYVVTGHYAQVAKDPTTGRTLLKKGVDPTKDQSYVLFHMTQHQLSHLLLPLGSLPKTEVRRLASEFGFINAEKHDSQDICFVPDGDYAAFIEKTTGKQYNSGRFIDEDGNTLGTHKGLIHYTIGQRKGLGLSLPRPLYVADKNIAENTVLLAENKELYRSSFLVDDCNWISIPELTAPMQANVKARYRHQEQPATITPQENGVLVNFEQPQRAITPGQAAVFYDGDTVIGGGTIRQVY